MSRFQLPLGKMSGLRRPFTHRKSKMWPWCFANNWISWDYHRLWKICLIHHYDVSWDTALNPDHLVEVSLESHPHFRGFTRPWERLLLHCILLRSGLAEKISHLLPLSYDLLKRLSKTGSQEDQLYWTESSLSLKNVISQFDECGPS